MSVKTIVKVTLEIATKSSWGDNTTVAQVKKQSLDEADIILAKAFEKDGNTMKMMRKPEYVSIIFNEDL